MSGFASADSSCMEAVASCAHPDSTAATPDLTAQPPGCIHTATITCQSDMTAYQPMPAQVVSGSFFEDAIDSSPVALDAGFGLPFIASPTRASESAIFGNDETTKHTLPVQEGNQELICRDGSRRQSHTSSSVSQSSASELAAEAPKTKKRGRKPKKQLRGGKETGERELDDDLPKDPRRRRILERNRIAATKCRLRKRDEASALACREQAMEDQNRYLSTCFDSLTTEIYHLKTQLLRHTDCNCKLIQKYIANEAQKSVDGLLACSSAFHSYGGSMSPDYGGSSSASTAESLNMPPSETDNMPPGWINPFQDGHKASFSNDMFDLGVETFPKVEVPPDPTSSAQSMSTIPLAGYLPGLYVHIGSQNPSQEEMSWSTSW